MLKEACTVGMKIYFGRSNGQQTLAEIVKLNQSKAKVRTLEGRGHRDVVGQMWSVPYDMMKLAGQDEEGEPTPKKEPLTYSPFAGEDNLILEAICIVHSGLSLENLACDGEASMTHIRTVGAELRRKLKHLQLALGREVDEVEAFH